MYRVIDAKAPAATENHHWAAWALLEAPDADGEWTAIEAGPVPEGQSPPSRYQTNHAEHADGWYRVQWHDTAQNSVYSDPVQPQHAPPERRYR